MQLKKDDIFITRQGRVKSGFERRYLEKFHGGPEFHTETPGFSPQIIQIQEDFLKSQNTLDGTRAQHEKWMIDHKMRENMFNAEKESFEQIESNEQIYKSKLKAEIEQCVSNVQCEMDLIQKYEKELSELEAKKKEAENRLNSIEIEILHLEPSVQHLTQFLTYSSQFEDNEEMIQRFDDLTQFSKYFLKKEDVSDSSKDSNDSDLYILLAHLQQELIEKNQKLLTLNEKIKSTHIQNRYDLQEILKVEERNQEKEQELATIISSIKNISKYAADVLTDLDHVTETGPLPDDVDSQLEIIEEKFDLLKQILARIQS